MDANCSLLLFRNEVKTRYASQPHVYHQLVQLLQRFNMKKIDVQHLKASVDLLLIDNSDLIQMFDSQMVMLQCPTPRKSKMFCESSRDFVLRVKEVFEKKGRPEQYKSFVSILRNVGSSSLKDTLALVEVLFHEEPELFEEFQDMITEEFLRDGIPNAISVAISCRSPPMLSPASPTLAKMPTFPPSSNIVMSAQRRVPLGEAPKYASSSALPTKPLVSVRKVTRSKSVASELVIDSHERKGKNKKSKAKSDHFQKDKKKHSKLNKLARSFIKVRIDEPTTDIDEDIVQDNVRKDKSNHISSKKKLQGAILRIKNWKSVSSPPGSPPASPRSSPSSPRECSPPRSPRSAPSSPRFGFSPFRRSAFFSAEDASV